jgi:K+-transporting ATPase ATPase C chain
MKHNPTVQKSDIPSDMVTASGAGLDPNISVQAAKVQAQRIADIRKVDISKVNSLIEKVSNLLSWECSELKKLMF